MTPIDENEPEAAELSQEEVEEIVGGLGETLGSGTAKPGSGLRSRIYGSTAGIMDYMGRLLDDGSTL